MDISVRNSALELSKTIENSPVYEEYSKLRDEIRSNPELKIALDEYKAIQTSVELKELRGQEVSDEERTRLDECYSKVSLSELSLRFIESEKKVVLMLSEVYKLLEKNIDIDMDFFDKL